MLDAGYTATRRKANDKTYTNVAEHSMDFQKRSSSEVVSVRWLFSKQNHQDGSFLEATQ